MTVREALAFFSSSPKVLRRLQVLDEIGLGYLRLGQPATTLSGGEAQRIKIAAHLSSHAGDRVLYILDEPTTGLHFDDIAKLLAAFRKLIQAGHSLLVIEHNLDVIKTADWVIDLGPEGGEAGGEIVTTGTPEHIAQVAASHTGRLLAGRARRRARQRVWGGKKLKGPPNSDDKQFMRPMVRVLVSSLLLTGLTVPSHARQTGFEDVIRNLRNPDPKARLSAVRMLRESQHTAAAVPVAAVVNDPLDEIQLEAIAAELSFFLVQDMPLRKRVGLVVEVRSKGKAAQAFEQGPLAAWPRPVPPEVVDALLKAVDDENPRVRIEAIYALGAVARPPLADGASERLIKALDHYDPAIRAAAARVAGRLDVKRAGDTLIKSINDSSPPVRFASMRALGEIRDERAVQSLMEQLKFYGKGEGAWSALDALARIAHPSSASLFKTRISDKDPAMRRAAAEGLARIGDASEAPAIQIAATSESSEMVRAAMTFAMVKFGQNYMARLIDFFGFGPNGAPGAGIPAGDGPERAAGTDAQAEGARRRRPRRRRRDHRRAGQVGQPSGAGASDEGSRLRRRRNGGGRYRTNQDASVAVVDPRATPLGVAGKQRAWRAPARATTPLGGPAGRSPPGFWRAVWRAPASGAGRWGPRERRRWGVRRGEAPRGSGARCGAPRRAARGDGAPASDAAGGSGGAKPPGRI